MAHSPCLVAQPAHALNDNRRADGAKLGGQDGRARRLPFAARGVAQPGSALRSGRRGPQFKSGHPDRRGGRSARERRPPRLRLTPERGHPGGALERRSRCARCAVVLRAVVFDVDFTLARPGPGPRAGRLPRARAAVRARARPGAVRGGAGGGVRRGEAASRARPRRGDLGALHRADHHRHGRPRRHVRGRGRDGAALGALGALRALRRRAAGARRACGRAGCRSGCSRTRRATSTSSSRTTGSSPTRCSPRTRTARRSRTRRSSARCSSCSTSSRSEAVMVGDTLEDDIEGALGGRDARRAARPGGPVSGDRGPARTTCAGSPAALGLD